jgi:hypothetical protein
MGSEAEAAGKEKTVTCLRCLQTCTGSLLKRSEWKLQHALDNPGCNEGFELSN